MYKTGNKYRSTAVAEWLSGNQPATNSQDILALLHTDGFLSQKADMSATRWYDWSNDGVNYITETDDVTDFTSEVGSGIACSFKREVSSVQYNALCKNFKYRVIIESTNNSNGDVRDVLLQASFQRGIAYIQPTVDISLAIDESGSSPGISVGASYVEKFANPIQAEVIYTINP